MPLVNQQMYVLNDALEDCPEYVTGDIYIGGIGLAREYWNNEEKTNQAFIEHPIKKCRLYKTGDLGRFMPDGTIEFLGREDHQVKIGGFRIEMGEIESVLNKHELVNRAVVVKKKDHTGNEKLECLIVPAHPLESPSGQHSGMIMDKDERKKFKLSQQGIRRSALGKTNIDLNLSQNGYYQNYVMRASSRRFLNTSIDLALLGEFLSSMSILEHNGSLRRRYASAGSSYPVQVYLCQHKNRINGLENNSLYYYNPLLHSLNKISDRFPIMTDYHENENREIYNEESFSVFLIANKNAIEPLYGKRALEFCLIEAGLMTQIMETAGVNTGIGICQIGSYKNYDFIKNFNLPDENYQLIHSFIAGKVDFEDNERSLPRHEDGTNQYCKSKDTLAILKEYAQNELPGYMCPSGWKIISDIPLTSNGKVDYSAISYDGEKETVIDNSQVPLEKPVLQEVSFKNLVMNEVSEVLGTQDIDIDANFFEIGIDSKTIVKVWRGAVDQSKIKFPLTSVFEHTTVRKLANYLENIKNQ
jgi:SagB-type dehydrogenase family enzyme